MGRRERIAKGTEFVRGHCARNGGDHESCGGNHNFVTLEAKMHPTFFAERFGFVHMLPTEEAVTGAHIIFALDIHMRQEKSSSTNEFWCSVLT